MGPAAHKSAHKLLECARRSLPGSRLTFIMALLGSKKSGKLGFLGNWRPLTDSQRRPAFARSAKTCEKRSWWESGFHGEFKGSGFRLSGFREVRVWCSLYCRCPYWAPLPKVEGWEAWILGQRKAAHVAVAGANCEVHEFMKPLSTVRSPFASSRSARSGADAFPVTSFQRRCKSL